MGEAGRLRRRRRRPPRDPAATMTLIAHLTELRNRIAKALLALLLASACASTTARQPPITAEESAALNKAAELLDTAVDADPAAEDARLLAFLDAAFDESVALSPQSMTALGIKRDYDKLDDYTEAQDERELALAEAQLALMNAEFAPENLTDGGRLSYRLCEREVT